MFDVLGQDPESDDVVRVDWSLDKLTAGGKSNPPWDREGIQNPNVYVMSLG